MVVLSGAGKAFCAGADLGWMAKAIAYSQVENLADAEDFALMLERLDTLPVPVIGRVHGAALGGGVGLAAVCDIVVAAEDAVFGLTRSEARHPAGRHLAVRRSQDWRLGRARAVPHRQPVRRGARA